MNIYVGNLSREVSELELNSEFSKFGNVRSAKIVRDMLTGQSLGFAFVEMPVTLESEAAIQALNTKNLKGKKIVVSEAKQKRANGVRNNYRSGFDRGY